VRRPTRAFHGLDQVEGPVDHGPEWTRADAGVGRYLISHRPLTLRAAPASPLNGARSDRRFRSSRRAELFPAPISEVVWSYYLHRNLTIIAAR